MRTKMDANKSPVYLKKEFYAATYPIHQDQNRIRRNKCKRTQKREREAHRINNEVAN